MEVIKRIDLSHSEYEYFLNLISEARVSEKLADADSENQALSMQVFEKVHNPKIISISDKKANATKKATQKRVENVRAKIQNAINILRMENKEMTLYSISKTGSVSYQTVAKYITKEDLETLNRIV